MVYESGDRSASVILKWVSLRVPNRVDKVPNVKDIEAKRVHVSYPRFRS